MSVTGGLNNFSLLNTKVYAVGIGKGETYQLRYRAWNINGPGEWSETGYIKAARTPSRPIPPLYVESTSSSITLSLTPSSDDGGSIITEIVLEIAGYLSSNWAKVTTYSDNSLIHTLTVADDGLVPYSIYRFRVKTVNYYGNSDYSAELPVAVAPLPSQPPPVIKQQLFSSTTQINVKWAPPPDV